MNGVQHGSRYVFGQSGGKGHRCIKVVLREAQVSRVRWRCLTKLVDHVIGLFHGMFEKNTMTFNPGWDSNAATLDSFTDVRELQRQLKAQGVELVSEADESTEGPASLIIMDPDGNPILIDQHV